jgi:hypothetical protein
MKDNTNVHEGLQDYTDVAIDVTPLRIILLRRPLAMRRVSVQGKCHILSGQSATSHSYLRPECY